MSSPAWLNLPRALVDTILADALIAASAMAKNLPLVTTNLRHFKEIAEIEVIPF